MGNLTNKGAKIDSRIDSKWDDLKQEYFWVVLVALWVCGFMFGAWCFGLSDLERSMIVSCRENEHEAKRLRKVLEVSAEASLMRLQSIWVGDEKYEIEYDDYGGAEVHYSARVKNNADIPLDVWFFVHLVDKDERLVGKAIARPDVLAHTIKTVTGTIYTKASRARKIKRILIVGR